MASITIRRLDESTKARLRVRAAQNGRSMEEEAREILRAALAERRTGEGNLAASIRRRFAAVGGVELADLPREPMRGFPELMRPSPSARVLGWLAEHPPSRMGWSFCRPGSGGARHSSPP